ncbi:MFS transporter [Dehalococcoides mccartyi]|uniref:MFS transporter n=1 Tax=Dehalococcoides mccartyi TaxID=61435 RepID=UPI002FCB6E07
MRLFKFLKPKPTISEKDITTGLRWLTLDGMVSQGFNSITTSGILAAYALALGANVSQIGVMAAIPFLMQTFQIFTILLVEKIRRRKAIAVISFFVAQLVWVPVALIPLLVLTPSTKAVYLLLGLLILNGLFRSVTTSSWNSWIRDLVPQQILGRFFSRRMAFAGVVGAVFSLGAAFFVDHWTSVASVDNRILSYTIVLLFGITFLGLASPVFMSLMSEPMMQPVEKRGISLKQRLAAPLKDKNFKKLVSFLLFWNIASNLAIPFFAVYMLTRLGLPLSWIIGLSIISQLFNIVFLRVWGALVDRFGNKVILSMCASLYLLVILGWLFTAMPERYFLTIPLLVVLHVFAGIAMAGVNLTVSTIGLKLAPSGEAVSYLASASIATNLGTGLGPLIGGVVAQFFDSRYLNFTLTWADQTGTTQLPVLLLNGLDFLFAIAFIMGLATIGLLTSLREEGEVGSEIVLNSLLNPTREFSRSMSSAPALGFFSDFPFSYLKRIRIPGLDVALGVTIYQIAEISRIAATTALRGRRLSQRFSKALEKDISELPKSREEMRKHGIEISRQAARGAMHVVEEKPTDVEQIEGAIVTSVIKVVTSAGADPEDAILGASQGIIEGASETRSDLSTAARKTIEAATKVSKQVHLSKKSVITKVVEGTLQAAETISPEAVAQVKKSLPPENPLNKK